MKMAENAERRSPRLANHLWPMLGPTKEIPPKIVQKEKKMNGWEGKEDDEEDDEEEVEDEIERDDGTDDSPDDPRDGVADVVEISVLEEDDEDADRSESPVEPQSGYLVADYKARTLCLYFWFAVLHYILN